MKKYGKTVKLFLIDGEPNGRISCELSNWNGKAYKIPRTYIKNCIDRVDLNSTGIYLLFGGAEGNLDRSKVYIGEAEEILKRLNQHLKQRDFWSEAITFISKDDNLNKAHIKYLENRIYELAKNVGRYELVNSQIPNKPNISESDIAEMEEFLSNIRFLINILGHKLLEEKREIVSSQNNSTTDSENQEKLITFSIDSARGGKASGIQTSEGFVVFEMAQIANPVVTSFPRTMKRLRDEMIEEEIIFEKNGKLFLKKDYIFSSPSSAAMIVMGRSANGLVEWKTKEGKILRDVESE